MKDFHSEDLPSASYGNLQELSHARSLSLTSITVVNSFYTLPSCSLVNTISYTVPEILHQSQQYIMTLCSPNTKGKFCIHFDLKVPI